MGECHASCDDGHAITAMPVIPCNACPKFEVEFWNRIFSNHPEHLDWIAETKCPLIEEIHSCHEACRPGDHSCHHQCPRMHGFHHDFHGRKHAPGCYDTVAHECSCPPAVTESSCTAPNIWTDHCTSCITTSQKPMHAIAVVAMVHQMRQLRATLSALSHGLFSIGHARHSPKSRSAMQLATMVMQSLQCL